MRPHTKTRRPPAVELLLEEISPGHAIFSAARSERGRAAVADGTLCSTVIDFTLGAAVQSSRQGRGDHRVLEFKMELLQPGRPVQDPVRAVAAVAQARATRVKAVCFLFDASGALCACGSATMRLANRPYRAGTGDSTARPVAQGTPMLVAP
jgi:acyl-coenzyme A thioesterase PaaI-like protein